MSGYVDDMVQADSPSGWDARRYGEDSAAGLPVNSTSPGAYELFRLVKAGAGTIFGFTAYNSGAALIYIQLFDIARVPPTSTDIPVAIYPVAALNTLGSSFGTVGRSFRAGLVLASSSTQLSYTALSSAVVYFDAQYV